MNFSCANCRRLWVRLSLFLAVLVLTVGLCLEVVTPEHPTPSAKTSSATVLVQNSLLLAQDESAKETPTEKNQRDKTFAIEAAEERFESQFGIFNLFIIFFVTLGPLKIIPTFVRLTHRASRPLKQQLALRSAGISTVVIMLVVLLGKNLVKVWNIQLPALLIASGILLASVALQLVLAQYDAQHPPAPPPEQPGLHLAITPLAFPTILPPFGIAIALTLMIVATVMGLKPWAVISALLLVMVLNLVTMLAAQPILKFIRPVTLQVLGFTLGVMQFALGIQFILAGLTVQALVIQIYLQGQ